MLRASCWNQEGQSHRALNDVVTEASAGHMAKAGSTEFRVQKSHEEADGETGDGRRRSPAGGARDNHSSSKLSVSCEVSEEAGRFRVTLGKLATKLFHFLLTCWKTKEGK